MRSTSCDYSIIGERIKQIRKLRGYTQEHLAETINMSPKNISQLERGKMGISLSSLMAISKSLDISTDYILFGRTENEGGLLENSLSKLNETGVFYAEKIIDVFAEACEKLTKQ